MAGSTDVPREDLPEVQFGSAEGPALAALRTPLVEWLIDHGASVDEIERAATSDQLELLAGEVALRVGKSTLTLSEAGERVGLSVDVMTALWRAAGFVEREPGVPVLADAEIEGYFRVLALSLQMFGLESTLELTRVLSSAVSTVADAMVSLFHTGLGIEAARSDETGVAAAQAASLAAVPLPALGQAVELLLRRHLVSLMRPLVALDVDSPEVDAFRSAIGFVDLVGFTARTQWASMVELNALIRSFNEIAHSTVSGLGGRVVKLIGDEVMFVVPDVDAACSASLEMLRRLQMLELEGRAGVAWGPVLTREGDYFGVPINVASRLTKLAQPGSVLLTDAAFSALSGEFRDDTRLHFSATEQVTVRGFDVALLVRSLEPAEAPHP